MDLYKDLAGKYKFQLRLDLNISRIAGLQYEVLDRPDHELGREALLRSSYQLAQSIPTLAELRLGGITVQMGKMTQLGIRVERAPGACRVIPQEYRASTEEPDEMIHEGRAFDQWMEPFDMKEDEWNNWPLRAV
jgi:hypothetical protein